MGDIKDYWCTWLWRDAVTKIITVNFIVWLLISALDLINHSLTTQCLNMLALPASAKALLMRPWTVFTYMFTQADFLHMLINMLWFMVFARLMCGVQGGVATTTLYIYGGLTGAAAFILTYSIGAGGSGIRYSMIGASCAVLAIIGATATMYPKVSVNLLFFGPVRLMWLAVAAVILFALEWQSAASVAAHLSGAAVGVIYALAKAQGIDITSPIKVIVTSIASRRVPTASIYETRRGYTRADEEEMDRLLAKVSRSGYASLSSDERQRLFDLSQKIRKH